jgi:hypothetical protein
LLTTPYLFMYDMMVLAIRWRFWSGSGFEPVSVGMNCRRSDAGSPWS